MSGRSSELHQREPWHDTAVEDLRAAASGSGGLVTETLDYDGGRQVTVYVPTGAPEAIVFAGDGQVLAPWGEDLSEAIEVPTTMVVGVHRTADETLRLHEYSLTCPRLALVRRFVAWFVA
jgi:hypothetical protein